MFSCNQWLDDHEDDFKTERKLRLLGKYGHLRILPCFIALPKSADIHSLPIRIDLCLLDVTDLNQPEMNESKTGKCRE